MAITYGFYNAVDEDRTYSATEFSSILDGVVEDGVFESIGNKFAVSAGSGLNINVDTGRAWFNRHWTLNDSVLTLELKTAESVLNRYDAVILEIDESLSVRANGIKILTGTPSLKPTYPTIKNNETLHQYPLAYVYVGAGVTQITSGNIKSVIGTSRCPYASGTLNEVTFTNIVDQLVAQFNSWLDGLSTTYANWREEESELFTTWFKSIEGQLTEDEAAAIQAKLDKVTDIYVLNTTLYCTPSAWTVSGTTLVCPSLA